MVCRMSLRTLSALEARVLAVLVEKKHTVPDSYPLSLNALTLGCNQKTAREPVMNVSESEVLAALESLKELSLAHNVTGGRVVRFGHNAAQGLGVPSQSVALLTALMLRGPQTSAELRLHTERLHRFADISSVEGFLEELAEREPKMVVKLPRAPGAREARWAHLLCGEVTLPAHGSYANPDNAANDNGSNAEAVAELSAELAGVKTEVAALRALVLRLAGELGVDADLPPSV